MAWVLLRRNQERVLERLKRRDYDSVALSDLGRMDELVYLMVELGFFEHLGLIEIERERTGIPDDLKLNMLAVMPVLSIPNIHQVPDYLFKDAGILRLVGLTARQIREGFNDKGKADKRLPFHEDDLRNVLKAVRVGSLSAWRRATLKELFDHKVIKPGGVWVIDGTKLLIPYGRPPDGAGEVWHNPSQAESGVRGDEVGYKLVLLVYLTAGYVVVGTWRVLAVQASELSVVREMVDEVLAVGGAHAIGKLLMDGLYADGDLLHWLKFDKDIDAMVRVDENMQIRADMLGLARLEPKKWETHSQVRSIQGHKQRRRVEVAYFEDLESWKAYPGKLNGFLLREAGQGEEETLGWVSTGQLKDGWDGYQQWRQRWSIENQGIRELKEGWGIEAELWGRNAGAVQMSVAMRILGYNCVTVYRTRQGSRLVAHGIRALGRELSVGPEVIIYASGEYAVLHIEELMSIVGFPVQESMRRDPLTRHKAKRIMG